MSVVQPVRHDPNRSCQHCPDRTATCHATCRGYAQRAAADAARRAARYAAVKAGVDARDVLGRRPEEEK